MELDKLIEKTGDGGCMLNEFLTGESDSDLLVCMDNDNSETAFCEELGENQEEEERDGDGDDEIEFDNNDHEEALISYKEAITALEEVSYFLEYKGHGMGVGSANDSTVTLRNESVQQKTIR